MHTFCRGVSRGVSGWKGLEIERLVLLEEAEEVLEERDQEVDPEKEEVVRNIGKRSLAQNHLEREETHHHHLMTLAPPPLLPHQGTKIINVQGRQNLVQNHPEREGSPPPPMTPPPPPPLPLRHQSTKIKDVRAQRRKNPAHGPHVRSQGERGLEVVQIHHCVTPSPLLHGRTRKRRQDKRK